MKLYKRTTKRIAKKILKGMGIDWDWLAWLATLKPGDLVFSMCNNEIIEKIKPIWSNRKNSIVVDFDVVTVGGWIRDIYDIGPAKSKEEIYKIIKEQDTPKMREYAEQMQGYGWTHGWELFDILDNDLLDDRGIRKDL